MAGTLGDWVIAVEIALKSNVGAALRGINTSLNTANKNFEKLALSVKAMEASMESLEKVFVGGAAPVAKFANDTRAATAAQRGLRQAIMATNRAAQEFSLAGFRTIYGANGEVISQKRMEGWGNGGGGGGGGGNGGGGGARKSLFGASNFQHAGRTLSHWGTNLIIGGGAVIGASAYEAAQAEQARNLFMMGTGYNARQMSPVDALVRKLAPETAQTYANLYGQLYTIQKMGLPVGSMTTGTMSNMIKFGDIVQLASRGQISTDQADSIGIGFAHQMGLYKPDQIAMAMQALARAEFILPHGLDKLATQGKYYAPIMNMWGQGGNTQKALNDVLAMQYFIDSVGLSSGRGGTAIRAMLQNINPGLMLTKSNLAGKLKLLRDMGIVGADGVPAALQSGIATQQGDTTIFDPWTFAKELQHYIHAKTSGLHGEQYRKAVATILANFQGVFGAQGGLIGAILSGPQGVTLLNNYVARENQVNQQNGGGSIDAMQAQLLTPLTGKWQKMTSSFVNMLTALGGGPNLENFKHIIDRLTAMFDALTKLFQQNPGMARLVIKAAEWTVGLGLLSKFFGGTLSVIALAIRMNQARKAIATMEEVQKLLQVINGVEATAGGAGAMARIATGLRLIGGALADVAGPLALIVGGAAIINKFGAQQKSAIIAYRKAHPKNYDPLWGLSATDLNHGLNPYTLEYDGGAMPTGTPVPRGSQVVVFHGLPIHVVNQMVKDYLHKGMGPGARTGQSAPVTRPGFLTLDAALGRPH